MARSRVAEMVAEEADRVEAEEELAEPVEQETEPEPDELAEPVEPEPEEELSSEARLDAFEQENARHAAELASIMREDFLAFAPCLVCDGIGYAVGHELRRDPELEMCPHCAGEGQLTTGSRRETKLVRDCTRCMGEGFIQFVAQPPQPAAVAEMRPRYDPYTGQLLDASPVAPDNGQVGPWAPGYTPPGQPVT